MKKSGKKNKAPVHTRYGFEMLFKEDEQYYFRFNNTEGAPIFFSIGFQSVQNCEEGIQAVIKAARMESAYELQETGKGKYFFTLNAAKGKEIGRSILFDTLDAMALQMNLMQHIDDRVPQHGLLSDPRYQENLKTGIKRAAEARPTPEVAATGIPVTAATHREESEKMPRYKFSVIYYPDSKVWMIKNDFSGVSFQMNTCDGSQIESFIRSQMPDLFHKPASPALVEERTPAIKAEELVLVLQDTAGRAIKHVVAANNLGALDIRLPGVAALHTGPMDVRVVAKSLTAHTSTLVGILDNLYPERGHLRVALEGARGLLQGLYRLQVEVRTGGADPATATYHGTCLMMLSQ